MSFSDFVVQESSSYNSLAARSRLHQVKRSDSLRSQSSSASDSKRVSFNNDVKVKRIPNKSKLAAPSQQHQQQQHYQQPFVEFQKEEPPTDPKEVAEEAERILRQLVSNSQKHLTLDFSN